MTKKIKAIKGCTNRDCEEFKKKRKYKKDDRYCKKCGWELHYVCKDCWKVLPDPDEKYCVNCKSRRNQKIANNGKVVGGAVAGAAAVGMVVKQLWDVAKNVIKK